MSFEEFLLLPNQYKCYAESKVDDNGKIAYLITVSTPDIYKLLLFYSMIQAQDILEVLYSVNPDLSIVKTSSFVTMEEFYKI